MGTVELLELIEKLPADEKKQVEDFVLSKVDTLKAFSEPVGLNDRGYGSMKGLITFISEDFDEPLEDFKDYM